MTMFPSFRKDWQSLGNWGQPLELSVLTSLILSSFMHWTTAAWCWVASVSYIKFCHLRHSCLRSTVGQTVLLIASLLLTVNIQLGPPTNPLKIAIAYTVHAHKLVCYTVMIRPIFSLFFLPTLWISVLQTMNSILRIIRCTAVQWILTYCIQ